MLYSRQLGSCAVTVHTYRAALLAGPRYKVPREMMRELEIELAQSCKRALDNHTTYRVEEKHGGPTFFMFSDDYAYIGGAITHHPRGY